MLKEYEPCQSDNNGLGSQSWVSISILVTVNLLLLGQVVYNLILTSDPTRGYVRFILILLGLAMIFILLIFKRWKQRIDFIIRLNRERMREIEQELKFTLWKNWRVQLDLYYGKEQDEQKRKKWETLNDELKEMIEQLSKRYPKDKKTEKDENYETLYRLPTTEGKFWKLQFKFECIFYALIALWILIMIVEALKYCPTVYGWLFN